MTKELRLLEHLHIAAIESHAKQTSRVAIKKYIAKLDIFFV